MSRLLLALPLLLAAGCTTRPAIVTMNIQNPAYVALGGSPGWILMIGDDQIALRTPIAVGEGRLPAWRDSRFPRTLPRTVDGVRRWQSSGAGENILVEARREPCRRGQRAIFEDSVRVTLDEMVLEGCGGRQLREGERG